MMTSNGMSVTSGGTRARIVPMILAMNKPHLLSVLLLIVGLTSTTAVMALTGCGVSPDAAGHGTGIDEFGHVSQSLSSSYGDHKPGQPGYVSPISPRTSVQSLATHVGDAPAGPPPANDTTFVVDQGAGLDTGCTFRSGGPLVFTIKVGRVVGDVALLKSSGLIEPMAELSMPAFDVDFDAAVSPPFFPERDRVTFNGYVVPTEFLTGGDNLWKVNSFMVPIEWVKFPVDPGVGKTPTAEDNVIQIDIDTANTDELWCTSIDWAALSIKVAKPVVMVHGILSSGDTWSGQWVPQLGLLGLPNTNELNMGSLESIKDNSAKIAKVVASSEARWGVDKVNLVCHSKGGLDSRDYAEAANDVDRLVQLGTPNAGSPLADFVQGTLVGLIGVVPTAIVNSLAGSAGLELTRPSMKFYNDHHGINPQVEYTALAGDYIADCFFCLDRLLLAITGPGDTIVPIPSVFALGFKERNLRTEGKNEQAKHTELTGSIDAFFIMSDRVKAFEPADAIGPAPPSFVRTATVGSAIAPGQTQIQLVPVETATPTYFSLLYLSGDLSLALISPSGHRFDAVNVQGDPTIGHDKGPILGGLAEAFSFTAPEAGMWQAEITANNVVTANSIITASSVTGPSGMTAYAVNAWLQDPTVTFAGAIPRTSVHANEILTFTGTLRRGGAPLLGASVAVTVALPDDTTRVVTLHDDGLAGDEVAGDGVYAGQLSETTLPGNYRVLFRASGTDPSFSREDFGLATVSRSTSTIEAIRDHGLDTDGDGLFNKLAVEVDLNITDPGTYRIFAVLSDSNGNTQQANIVEPLSPGLNTLSLGFDGATIFQRRVDGPYTLSVVRLAEEDGLAILPVEELRTAHQTATYSFHQFQHAPIILSGDGSSVGVDTNGNGLFDLLAVNLVTEVDNAGFYSWSARLIDGNGRELGFTGNAGFLHAGTNTLQLFFDGQAIGSNGTDGPYFVANLLLFGAGHSLIATRAFTTDAFHASQFEGFVLDQTPPKLTISLSPSVLSPPDHKLQEIVATITVSDNVDPNPTVKLVSITSSEPDDGLGDGDTPNDIQGADFGTDDRRFFLRAERSGTGLGRTYTVTYQAADASGNTTTVTAPVIVVHSLSKK